MTPSVVPVRYIQDNLLLTQWTQLHYQVASRAFELFEASGREHGHATEHWLRAEAEVHNRATVRIEETESEIRLHANLKLRPGEQVEVGIRPNHLFIVSSSANCDRNHTKSRSQQLPPSHILKCVQLSCALEPQRVTARLFGERLEVVIAKHPVCETGENCISARAA